MPRKPQVVLGSAKRTGDPPRWLDQDELLAWKALWTMLVRLPAALESQLQRETGLTAMDYYVLALLSDEPNRTMRMSDLARRASASPSRLAHLARRLEGQGFIRREVDPDNKRFTWAHLTPEGMAKLVDSAPGHVSHVRELVLDPLGPEAFRSLAAAAEVVLRRVQDVEGDPRESTAGQRGREAG